MEHLLIVEDNGIVANDLSNMLFSLGYQTVSKVRSGEEAIKITQKEQIDLVLMDVGLSGKIDGIQASKLIHAAHKIPVLFISALAFSTASETTHTNPAFGMLAKPFSLYSLKLSLDDLAAKRSK